MSFGVLTTFGTYYIHGVRWLTRLIPLRVKIISSKNHENIDFTLPIHDRSGTIMYLDENFLCENALKVNFTLSFLNIGKH